MIVIALILIHQRFCELYEFVVGGGVSWFSNVKNTMEQNTPGFFNIAEKLYPYMDKDYFDTSLYVLSNKDRTFGVSVLLYDNTDILKDCLNKVKD